MPVNLFLSSCLALLQSPVSSVSASVDRPPVQSSRRRLFSGGSVPSSPAAAPATNQTSAESAAVKEQTEEPILSPGAADKVDNNNKPKKAGSLGLFFRKVTSGHQFFPLHGDVNVFVCINSFIIWHRCACKICATAWSCSRTICARRSGRVSSTRS